MLEQEQISAIDKLPVQLSIRLILDDLAFSNALPGWFDAISIDYSAREFIIRQKLKAYLGGAAPPSCFSVLVPRKSGTKKLWTIPSVNDQIVLQALVSSFAEKLDEKCLDERVFSYRYNRQPERLALTDDSIAAWTRFKDETKQRCINGGCLLQFDLQNAFQSINRKNFYDFLSSFASVPVLTLLERLLDSFSPESGLPMVSDSVFFLGNAYLSQVDKIVRKHAPKFIRFVDDYRVFDESRERLENSVKRITADLEKAGFRINPGKLKLGSAQEFLDVASKLRYGADIDENGYVRPTVLRGLMRKEDIVSTISTSLDNPDKYLNEGFGRFQLGVIRKFRFNEAVANIVKPDAPTTGLTDLLSGDVSLVRRFYELLQTYSNDQSEVWRTVWLLYVAKDFDVKTISEKDGNIAAQLKATLDSVRSSSGSASVVRLWADKNAGIRVRDDDVSRLHDLDYIQSGELHCKECNK